jgi:hypothetical protein
MAKVSGYRVVGRQANLNGPGFNVKGVTITISAGKMDQIIAPAKGLRTLGGSTAKVTCQKHIGERWITFDPATGSTPTAATKKSATGNRTPTIKRKQTTGSR